MAFERRCIGRRTQQAPAARTGRIGAVIAALCFAVGVAATEGRGKRAPWRATAAGRVVWTGGTVAASPPAQKPPEARVSIDVREAEIVDIVSLLAEVAGFQVVFDPGSSCKLTLKLKQVCWQTALEAALRACSLTLEEESNIVRVTSVARLKEEAEQRRQLARARADRRERSVRSFRLSYARAAEMAGIVKRFLSARGEVVYDERTNTLIVID